MGALLISSITAALVSSGFLIWDYRKRRLNTRKALLMGYVTELVMLFGRTVMYYNQRLKHGISYSGLYEISGSDMLSQFTEVSDDPKVINAIIHLKERYFQIQRHVVEAARLAAEFSVQSERHQALLKQYGAQDKRVQGAMDNSQDAIARAKHAQGRALAFFGFDDMVEWTKTIINSAKKEINTLEVYSLEKDFYLRIKEKYEADLEYQREQSKQN